MVLATKPKLLFHIAQGYPVVHGLYKGYKSVFCVRRADGSLDDSHLTDIPDTAEHMLNLFQFYKLSTYLHLTVQPSDKLQLAVAVDAHMV